MKQQNNWQTNFASYLLLIALFSLILIPLKKKIMPRVKHTFVFDNRNQKFKIKRLSVVGDFSNWQERYYLYDEDNDGIWKLSLPLTIGWHSYRFLINGKRWIRDWRNGDYGGPYSNSVIYVDTLDIPKLKSVFPQTGRWLYQKADSLRFVFDQDMQKWCNKYAVSVELDSVACHFKVEDSSLVVHLPHLPDGEHDWQIHLLKKNNEMVLRKTGFFYVNLNNQPPHANAGHTQIIALGQKITLDGRQSFDPDFEPLRRFKWKLMNGRQSVKIKNRLIPVTTVQISKPGTYRFQLTVQDSLGLTDTDVTSVVVLPFPVRKYVFNVPDSLFRMSVKKMALVGEFNQWNATKNIMAYDSTAKQWQAHIALGPGRWEYKFVINDSLWVPDPKNPLKVSDGWNGFNSVRIIKKDSTFDGDFEKVKENAKELVIAFRPHYSLKQSYRWISDAQNPSQAWRSRANEIHFYLNAPKGTYYFYLIQHHGKYFNQPRILLIKHYQKTQWYDFQKTPAWADTAIIYELFLRRFTKQGNFKSLINSLPYLKKLGINTLWMLPVYQSPTEHGYAPTSLFQTAKHYGTLTDYRRLIAKAHQLGMKVLFDFVANHLSDQHRFVRAAYQNPKSPLRQWFYWKPDGTWGYHNDWDTLVNLNYHNPWVWHYMLQAAEFWQTIGVDGFRCDVAWAVPHRFWKNFRRVVKSINFNSLLLDEVLPRQPAFHDDEFDMSYDTDFYGNILDVLHGRKPISAIAMGIEKSRLNYPAGAKSLRYLENHDLPRFITQFGPQLTRMMAVVLFTVPGTPLIYYGQEKGAKEIRPYFYALNKTKWFDFYQKLIKFRRKNKALTKGSLQTVLLDDAKRLWWYRRKWGKQSVDVIINLSNDCQKLNHVPMGTTLKIDGTKFKRMQNQTIKIEGRSFMVIQRDEGR